MHQGKKLGRWPNLVWYVTLALSLFHTNKKTLQKCHVWSAGLGVLPLRGAAQRPSLWTPWWKERCPKCFAQLFYTPPLGPSPGWSPCRCGRLGSMPQDHRPRRRRRECTSRRGGRWDGCAKRKGPPSPNHSSQRLNELTPGTYTERPSYILTVLPLYRRYISLHILNMLYTLYAAIALLQVKSNFLNEPQFSNAFNLFTTYFSLLSSAPVAVSCAVALGRFRSPMNLEYFLARWKSHLGEAWKNKKTEGKGKVEELRGYRFAVVGRWPWWRAPAPITRVSRCKASQDARFKSQASCCTW